MWFAQTNRKLLLDLIKKRDPYGILNIQSAKKIKPDISNQNELIFIWNTKPVVGSYLPEIIVVSEGKVREFLAWASTYISSFRPFTAFCRVLDTISAENFLSVKHVASLNNLEGACIGVIIGEVLSHFFNTDIKKLIPLAIKNTYSFAMARGYTALGLLHKDDDIIDNHWKKACILIGQPERTLNSEIIRNVWEILISLDRIKPYKGKLSKIHEACCNIIDHNSIGEKIWLELIKGFSNLKNLNEQMKGSLEQRVLIFEGFAEKLHNQAIIDKMTAEFLCGYLASQIEPGTMNHVELLRPYIKSFPGVILWYGLCAGIYQKTDVHNYADGFGWRIIRDLFQWIPDHGIPKCDIALDELEVMLNVEQPDYNFRVENPTWLIVEILPSVYSVFLWYKNTVQHSVTGFSQ